MNIIDSSPKGVRTDYLNEIAGILFIAESHIVNGLFDAAGFHADLKDALEQLNREKPICSFEEVYKADPQLIDAQPDDFLAATRLIAEQFDDLYRRGILTAVAIREFSRRLEGLRTDPHSEPPQSLEKIMGPEVAITTYINELSALYSVAETMIKYREQVRQLGVEENILVALDGYEGQLVRPLTERFGPEVLVEISPEYHVAFDDLAEELNCNFRQRTLTEEQVIDVVHRMEALKEQFIGGRS